MAEDQSHSSLSVTKLTSSYYNTWKGEMKAVLLTKGLWTIVSGTADKAAGELYLALSSEQRTHVDAVQDDPVHIGSTLASIHLQQRPGARFNAWDDFFSIRKHPDESLNSLIATIEDSMSKIQELRPKDSTTPYSIKEMDNELVCMAMVRSLGKDYSHFASSLLLFQSLDNEKLKEAFLAEESQRKRRPDAGTSDTALFTSSANCKCPSSSPCAFCDYPGHFVHKCVNMERSKAFYRSRKNKKDKMSTTTANQASTLSASSPATGTAPTTPSSNPSASQAVEFAGNASLRFPDPSSLLCPLQLDADIHWIADSGATAHMTLHRHWLRNYSPKHIPIKLADNKIVYSAGIGSVLY
ncbi:hypothetical protein M404DRAFT_35803 [Pisolithus tinctorius Marx 270]|uniref:Retrovirus-related Pol polyprotein from transposon TNT 1-94-like beta-barrel domain-containing protein n=1 Tax=Pisolithus tinctorius Marx 270 TaxID=870435 RepID=A0A0C3MXU1_PISTI|nr:hypothetical protein M404DRAFT_36598 [Pisolithus tinctorius Marx 270]KIN93724.1 hypothetical protein M404DRAFT_35803 [Pisolithus tinctorius Marx 270]